MKKALITAVFIALFANAQAVCAQRSETEWGYMTIPDSPSTAGFRMASVESENGYPIGPWNRFREAYEEVVLHVTLHGSESDPDVILIELVGEGFFVNPDQPVAIQIDDGRTEKREIRARPASKNRVVFDDDGFIARLRGARQLIVEIDILGHGPKEFTFNVSGLQWR